MRSFQVKFIILCISWLVLAGQATAQRTRPKAQPKLTILAMKGRSYGDSIVLRWSVNQGAYWLIANQRGYVLDRIQYIPGRARPLHKRLTVSPLKPWPLDTMKKRLRRDDRYAAIAAQVLYGKTYRQTVNDESVGLYKSYQEQQGKLLMAAMAAEFSPGAASALALRYVDRTFDKRATRCEYRLWINNGPKPKPNDLRDTAVAVVVPWHIDSLAAPRVIGVEAGDGTLKLRWHTTHPDGRYTGYFIERSDDGKTFRRLNTTPYVLNRPDTLTPKTAPILTSNEAEYIDSIKVNYRRFYYRIIGVNSFADFSPVSKIMTGSGRDLTPPVAPSQLTQQIQDNKRVTLSWTMSSVSPDLKGFVVARAADINGPYQPVSQAILPAASRSFVDEKPVAYTGRYYVVAAVDTAGNLGYSMPIMAAIADKTPPAPPRGLRVKVDTNGVAHLQWPANTEADAIGYKVYRSYQRNDQFYQQLTPVILADTMYADTLPTNSLTRQAYYKLAAIDLTNNHSDFSEPFEVAIPDKIAPATPVIRMVNITEKGVQLTIIPSLSSDVVEHMVYRRQDNQPWLLIRRLNGHPLSDVLVLDSSATHQTTYNYSVIARDANGHLSDRSFAVPVTHVNLKQLMLSAPTSLKAAYDPQRKLIQLNWVGRQPAGTFRYLIYRSVNNEGLSLYKSVSAISFDDQDISQPGSYTYAIRLVSSDQQSGLSTPTTVKFPN